MQINKTRLTYWFAKTSRPFNGISQECPSIHKVINSKSDKISNTDLQNTLNLVKIRHRQGKPAVVCLSIGAEWVTSKGRQVILKRWQRNLERSQKR